MRTITHEPRVIAGIALMIAATIIGALFMQRATQRTTVWRLSHSLTAGTVISSSDVHLSEVSIDGGGYAGAGTAVVGRALKHDIGAGELLPVAALTAHSPKLDEVSVPVAKLHAPPDLRRGQRVDVWWSSKTSSTNLVSTARVLHAVRVLGVATSDVGGGQGMVLAVPPAQVRALVLALRSGEIDLARVDR